MKRRPRLALSRKRVTDSKDPCTSRSRQKNPHAEKLAVVPCWSDTTIPDGPESCCLAGLGTMPATTRLRWIEGVRLGVQGLVFTSRMQII